jgi:hypothetical protein
VINVLAFYGVVIRGAGGPGTASEATHAIRQASRPSCCKPLHHGHNLFQSLDDQIQVFAEVDLLLTALDQAVAELSPPASANGPTTQP